MIRQPMCVFIRTNTLLLCIFLFCIFLLYCADSQVEVQIRILLKDKYRKSCQTCEHRQSHFVFLKNTYSVSLFQRNNLLARICLSYDTALQSRSFLKNIENFLCKQKLVNNRSIPSTHAEKKLPFVLINTLLLDIPLLAFTDRQTDKQTDRQRNELILVGLGNLRFLQVNLGWAG